MHDRKGRPIEVGDFVKFRTWIDNVVRQSIGRVATVHPATSTCNLQVVHVVHGYFPLQMTTLTAKETEVLLKDNGDEVLEPTQEDRPEDRIVMEGAPGIELPAAAPTE